MKSKNLLSPFSLLTFTAILILFSSITSCRKAKDTEFKPQDNLVQKFFEAPQDASDALKSLIADIKKQEEKNHFVNTLVGKYGFPAWGKSIANIPIRKNSTDLNSRTATSDSIQLFLIPFIAPDSSVSSYLACSRNGDEFDYRFYKKDRLSTLYASNDSIKILRMTLLSVFGYFEKTINNKDSVLIAGIYNKSVKDVSINFRHPGSSGRTLTNGRVSDYHEYYIDICWQGMLAARLSDLYCEYFLIYSSVNNIGWGGYGGEPGGGEGGTPGSMFPDGYVCPDGEWWCLSGDFRYIDGILCTPESYPGINAGYSWLWWENQTTTANEIDPNVTDNDPNIIWWDESTSDPNTVYTQQAKPNWQNVNDNYPKTANGTDDLPAYDVCVMIGGQVLAQHNAGNADNACALRVSRALNYSGINIPSITGQTWQGADGKNYFYYVEHLYNWLTKTFGPADIHKTAADGAPNGIKFPDQLIGLQNRGIYIMKPFSRSTFRASGHATLWGGLNCVGGHNYFASASDIYIWRLPQ